jgi:hypothetical protein
MRLVHIDNTNSIRTKCDIRLNKMSLSAVNKVLIGAICTVLMVNTFPFPELGLGLVFSDAVADADADADADAVAVPDDLNI